MNYYEKLVDMVIFIRDDVRNIVGIDETAH